MRPEPCQAQEGNILGRTLRWTDMGGSEYEADPKHRTKVLEYFGLVDGSKGLTYNGDKDDNEDVGEEAEMDPWELNDEVA